VPEQPPRRLRAPSSLLPDVVSPLDVVLLLDVVPPQMPAMDALSPFRKKQQQKEDQRTMDRIGLA
jgi:hypothetical protein